MCEIYCRKCNLLLKNPDRTNYFFLHNLCAKKLLRKIIQLNSIFDENLIDKNYYDAEMDNIRNMLGTSYMKDYLNMKFKDI